MSICIVNIGLLARSPATAECLYPRSHQVRGACDFRNPHFHCPSPIQVEAGQVHDDVPGGGLEGCVRLERTDGQIRDEPPAADWRGGFTDFKDLHRPLGDGHWYVCSRTGGRKKSRSGRVIGRKLLQPIEFRVRASIVVSEPEQFFTQPVEARNEVIQ